MTKSMFLATCLVAATLVSGLLLAERVKRARDMEPRWDIDPLAM